MKVSSFFLAVLALCVLVAQPAAKAVELANSITDFTGDGTQGSDGWTGGYRNYTLDLGGEDYEPDTEFIAFDQGTHWQGAGWRLVPANAPWTTLNAENAHPNGVNNTEEHWVIRRWLAPMTQPLAVTWHVRKSAAAGDGVSGSLHVEGVQVDSAALPGTDTTGVTRTYFINATEEERIDLALTPVGANGDRNDGSDGSSFWMSINDEVNDIEMQPDGTIFVASDALDSEPDMLADAWEEFYVPGDLSALDGTGVADFDEDGLTDLQEQTNRTNPVEKDTDMDGLEDFAEIDEHGTDPLDPDSDDDGLSDGDEVLVHMTDPNDTDSDDDGFDDGREVDLGTDPNDPSYTPDTDLVGNSEAEFSGEQGLNDWSYGYRDYTADGGGNDYNPNSDFIEFPGGINDGAWSDTNYWTGNVWDFNPVGAGTGNPPWTNLGATFSHPNSDNNGGEHWTIRRWSADELTTITPVALMWHVRKNNTNADGVTGAVQVNGTQIDANTIAGNDTTGSYRVVYANLIPGAKVDLAHSPEGINNRNDGADSSSNWLRISTRIGANPTQPDGSEFIPATGADSDADNLPDEWEFIYFPGDLDQLSGLGGADKDVDGSPDLEEFERGTNPDDTDSDDDGLTDGVETDTGTFVDADDTGTSPLDADTDGDDIDDKDEIDGTEGEVTDPTVADSDDDGLSDGREYEEGTSPNDADSDDDTFSDGEEVARGFDPLDPASNPGTLLADSLEDFSGTQGQLNWTNGYRNLGANPGAIDYKPDTDFIPFVGGEGMGAHVVDIQQWNNNRWDLDTAGAPWTEVAAEAGHPNGTNNVDEHWAIRRWIASELTVVTPLGLSWHLRATNPGGDGVTGSLHINGFQADTAAIAGSDAAGVTRTWYANVNPDDIIDLALTPVGPDGDTGDGADGSAYWLRIDTYIPPNAMQPDGTPFAPAAPTEFKITSIEFDNGMISVAWSSTAGRIYAVDFNTDLRGTWLEDVETITAEGDETSHTLTEAPDPLPARIFVRVRDVTDQQ